MIRSEFIVVCRMLARYLSPYEDKDECILPDDDVRWLHNLATKERDPDKFVDALWAKYSTPDRNAAWQRSRGEPEMDWQI